MSTVRLSDKAFVDKAKLNSLILGYSLISKLSIQRILPDEISNIINCYIPKQLWLKCGSELKIINDTTVSTVDNINESGSSVNAYSMDKADIAFMNRYKFIWKIKITDLPSQNSSHRHVDLRIGITSTIDHINTFTNSHNGHNYSYISYDDIRSHIGYNAKWTLLSSKDKDSVYWTNDIVTVDVNLRDRVISYFKNDKLITKQENIVQTSYRLGVNIMGQCGKMEIISFEMKKLDN